MTEAIYHTDERGRRRWRKAPKSCPRGKNDGPLLRCAGAVYKGERLSEPHMAEFAEFGHHKQSCEKGWSRCRDRRCRDCTRLYSTARIASNKSKFAGMSDDDIMANVAEKKCPKCKQVFDGYGFNVDRTAADGLSSYCRSCKSKTGNATRSAEAKQRGWDKRRANKKLRPYRNIPREQVYDTHKGICHLCKEPVGRDEFEVEHLVPYESEFEFAWLFGHVDANLAIAHRSCNVRKNNRVNSWNTIMANLQRDGSESSLWILENVVTKLAELDQK